MSYFWPLFGEYLPQTPWFWAENFTIASHDSPNISWKFHAICMFLDKNGFMVGGSQLADFVQLLTLCCLVFLAEKSTEWISSQPVKQFGTDFSWNFTMAQKFANASSSTENYYALIWSFVVSKAVLWKSQKKTEK